jgi:hypothetical protein
MSIKAGLTNIVSIKAGASTVITKVMAGTVLIWQLLQDTLTNFEKYRNKVKADGGIIEDETALQVDVDFEDADYNNAIAIYNPNGGYRVEKIFDIADLDDTNPHDLTVAGGGGTRFMPDGSLEEILFNKVGSSTYMPATNGGESDHNATEDMFGDMVAERWYPSVGGTGAAARWLNTFSQDFDHFSVFAKPENGNAYLTLFAGTSTVEWDLNTKQIIGTPSSNITYYTEEAANGYTRYIAIFETADSNDPYVAINFDDDQGSAFVTGVQICSDESIDLLMDIPYQATGSAAFPKIDYYRTDAAYLLEPSRTNYLKRSYYLIYDWDESETGMIAVNQVGITNKGYTAAHISDSGASSFAELSLRHPIESVSGTSKLSIWIKKDQDESRFPEVYIKTTSGVTEYQTMIDLNTKTGAFAYRDNNNFGVTNILDRTNWWEIVWYNDTSIDEITELKLRPAIGNTVLGVHIPNAVGNITVGHVGIYEYGKVQPVNIDEAPIITVGSASSTTTNEYTCNNYSINGQDVVIYAEIENGSQGGIQFDDGTLNNSIVILAYDTGKYWCFSKSQNTTTLNKVTNNYTVGQKSKIALVLNGSGGAKVFVNGVLEQTLGSISNPTGITNLRTRYNFDNENIFKGRIFALEVYNKTMTDQEGIDLTTL